MLILYNELSKLIYHKRCYSYVVFYGVVYLVGSAVIFISGAKASDSSLGRISVVQEVSGYKWKGGPPHFLGFALGTVYRCDDANSVKSVSAESLDSVF